MRGDGSYVARRPVRAEKEPAPFDAGRSMSHLQPREDRSRDKDDRSYQLTEVIQSILKAVSLEPGPAGNL